MWCGIFKQKDYEWKVGEVGMKCLWGVWKEKHPRTES
jgi:hypothetical protein